MSPDGFARFSAVRELGGEETIDLLEALEGDTTMPTAESRGTAWSVGANALLGSLGLLLRLLRRALGSPVGKGAVDRLLGGDPRDLDGVVVPQPDIADAVDLGDLLLVEQPAEDQAPIDEGGALVALGRTTGFGMPIRAPTCASARPIVPTPTGGPPSRVICKHRSSRVHVGRLQPTSSGVRRRSPTTRRWKPSSTFGLPLSRRLS